MNPNPESDPQANPEVEPQAASIPGEDSPEVPRWPGPKRKADYWIKRFLVCNPFFLCSAALLLYGINRLSIDPNFLSNETQNLLFNSSALQIYELLLAGTAIVLARRAVWYDSALLVVLENGLVLVPFMLISQAALIDSRLAWLLTIAGGLAVVGRFVSIRRGYPLFNLPGRALALGAVILTINVVLPRIFRRIIDIDYEAWSEPNLMLWYAALPVLTAAANFLPKPSAYGGLNPQRSWLPLFIFGLWIAGTGVHIWSIGYICKVPFQIHYLAPTICVAIWTIWRRLTDFRPHPISFAFSSTNRSHCSRVYAPLRFFSRSHFSPGRFRCIVITMHRSASVSGNRPIAAIAFGHQVENCAN